MRDLVEDVRRIRMSGTPERLAYQAELSFERLGFNYFEISTQHEDYRSVAINPQISNFPVRFNEQYIGHEMFDIDQSLQHAVKRSEVMFWRQRSDLRNTLEELLGDWGVNSTLIVPIEEETGHVGVVTLASCGSIQQPIKHKYEALIVSSVLALKLREISESLNQVHFDTRLNTLTEIQVEILRWSSFGKSNSDIAVILNVNKTKVDYHVAAILQKLEVKSKLQAVAVFNNSRSV